MHAVIVVPLTPTEDMWRRAAWLRTVEHLCSVPWPIAVGEGDASSWSKGAALADGVALAPTADVLVIHDADCIVSAPALRACVTACADGAPWAMPHVWVHRLNRRATCEVEAGRAMPWEVPDRDRDRLPYRGVPGGGVTVVRADVWADCPVDPRFIGWGGEDEAWGWALTTLYGPPWRPPAGDDRLYHLWHPHAAPRQRFPTRPDARALLQRYRNARRVPRVMRAVVHDTVPPPPTIYPEPVRYALLDGAAVVRSLSAGGQTIRFHRGVAEVTHSDAVDVLDHLAGVRRV